MTFNHNDVISLPPGTPLKTQGQDQTAKDSHCIYALLGSFQKTLVSCCWKHYPDVLFGLKQTR